MRDTLAPMQLDRMFFALSDANRRAMLERLSAGPTSVTELGQPLGIALPSVVKHLAVLESGGLVESEKLGRVRTYRITPNAFAAMEKWVSLVTVEFEAVPTGTKLIYTEQLAFLDGNKDLAQRMQGTGEGLDRLRLLVEADPGTPLR